MSYRPQTDEENAILIEFSEKRISAMEAVNRLEDIGFEPPKAKALLEAWIEFVAEHGSLQ
jgi:hypothetical protein